MITGSNAGKEKAMKYRILADERKKVVARLEELTGERAVYEGTPTLSFTIAGFTVGNDGVMLAEDNADQDYITILKNEGLIGDLDITGTDHSDINETADDNDKEDTEPDSDADHGLADDYADEGSMETEEVEENTEDADLEDIETEDSDTADPATADYEVHALKPEISMPLTDHTGVSVCNLVNTIYSRGKLISKATGGTFEASEELVDTLRLEGASVTREAIIDVIKDNKDSLTGISFTDDCVVFDGFPETDDPNEIRAWTRLASAINEYSIKQKRVLAKKVDDTNEKFSLRTWMTRLGMNGQGLKTARSVLYRNLSGHTAFRTDEDAEKWKTRQKVRNEAKKAAEAAGV